MFHGLTMVNFDGQTQNQMMVRPWSAMVDHGRPWSDGQTVAGAAEYPAGVNVSGWYLVTRPTPGGPLDTCQDIFLKTPSNSSVIFICSPSSVIVSLYSVFLFLHVFFF